MARVEPTLEQYAEGVRNNDRTILARAITLIESQKSEHIELAQQLLTQLLPHTGQAIRVGITGVPGVGKSTLVEALGMRLVQKGHRVAVLAVDPSSSVSGGSILGDKSRMSQLAQHDNAFIRPTPTTQTLGGVARRTRESLLVCEAAGYDVVLIETVGIGQSETMVADMVDTFLVLMLPGAGDELQGIKRGVLELADVLAINKADGDSIGRAKIAQTAYATALRYQRPRSPSWRPPVLTLSALVGDGIDDLWKAVCDHRETLNGAGELSALRRRQRGSWMWAVLQDGLMESFKADPTVAAELRRTEQKVLAGQMPPTHAAEQLLRLFKNG